MTSCSRVVLGKLPISWSGYSAKVRCRVHGIPPLDCILSQMIEFHALTFCLRNIHFDVILHLCHGLSSDLSSIFDHNFICICHVSCMFLVPLISSLLNLMILIQFGKEYNVWSPSSCNFLHPPIISCLFVQVRLLSAAASSLTSSVCSCGVTNQNNRNICRFGCFKRF